MKITYEQAKKDHQYLWSISPANDMTGGYVDQEDLDRLLSNPTKTNATDCFCRQIEYWFNAGTEDFPERSYWDLVDEFPKIEKIAERHRITHFWEGSGFRRKL